MASSSPPTTASNTVPGASPHTLPILPSDRYTALYSLGKGAYATVIAALDKTTGETVAIKIVKRSPPNIPLRSELDTITRLHKNGRNPNIVFSQDSFQDAEACYIVMEMLTGGDLYSRVEPNGPGLSKSEAKQWIYQLCVATQAVHAIGYVHADIKPENCLLDAENNLTLADFGLCVRNGYCHFCNVPGTEAYMSPELLGRGKKGTIMTTAVDVYAVGMTWYAMLFADLPWDVAAPRDPEFRSFAASGRLPGPAKAIGMLSPELHELLTRMLAPVPTDRPTMADVLRFLSTNQPWFVTKKKAIPVSASSTLSPTATPLNSPQVAPRVEAAAVSAMTAPAPAFALRAVPSPAPAVHASPALKETAAHTTLVPSPELSRARRASHIH